MILFFEMYKIKDRLNYIINYYTKKKELIKFNTE